MDSSAFVLLYVVTFLIIGIIMIAPIVIFVVLIVFLSKKSRQHNKEMQEQIMERHREKERLAQEEIDLKKMKYRRVRCLYCDTLNPLGESACKSCGASLESAVDVMEEIKNKSNQEE